MFNKSFSANQFLIRTGTIFLLLSYFFSIFFMVDPFDSLWGMDNIILIRYFPIVLSSVSLILYLSTIKWWKYLCMEFLLLIIFMVYVTIGSILTLIESSYVLGDSFIGRGICMLPILPAFMLFNLRNEINVFVKYSLGVAVAATIVITLILIFRTVGFGVVSPPHIYHEEIFMVVSIGLLLIITSKKIFPWQYLIGIIFILAGILTKKNTGFILTFAAVITYYYVYFFDYTKSKNRVMLSKIFGSITLITLITFISVILIFYIYLLPSGSPGVRLNTYLTRWNMFVESPIFGEFFMGTPIIELPSIYYSLFTPSHSDLLDILAFGGSVTFILFYYPVLTMIMKSFFNIRNYLLYVKRDIFYIYSISIVTGFIILMGFNPVWNQPHLASIFWISFAYLIVKNKYNYRNIGLKFSDK